MAEEVELGKDVDVVEMAEEVELGKDVDVVEMAEEVALGKDVDVVEVETDMDVEEDDVDIVVVPVEVVTDVVVAFVTDGGVVVVTPQEKMTLVTANVPPLPEEQEIDVGPDGGVQGTK
jgi:predicted transcriptional regulator